jgi:mono/diheme cytochrome c family protein
MSAQRFSDPVTDGDLDRALATALAVEPSPQFLARVRMRIASEPEPADWRFSWVYAAGACTVALAIVVTMMQMNHPTLSPGLPSNAFRDLSLLPALLPGPLAIAASGPRRVRRERATPEMQAIMRSNAAANAALAAHVQERNHDAILKDAATLKQNFGETEAFWAEKKMGAALIITRSGLQAAADLQAAALANDDAAIEKGAAAVNGTCGACHQLHREQLADGSYEIRL